MLDTLPAHPAIETISVHKADPGQHPLRALLCGYQRLTPISAWPFDRSFEPVQSMMGGVKLSESLPILTKY